MNANSTSKQANPQGSKTNQTDKATATAYTCPKCRGQFGSANARTADGTCYQCNPLDRITVSKSEHAALVAVAEAAEKFRARIHRGYCDDAMLKSALANLAAVRGEKAVQS